jgi:hypothetical protein
VKCKRSDCSVVVVKCNRGDCLVVGLQLNEEEEEEEEVVVLYDDMEALRVHRQLVVGVV